MRGERKSEGERGKREEGKVFERREKKTVKVVMGGE